MAGTSASARRIAVTRTLMAGVVAVFAAAATALPANATPVTSPDDSRCAATPELPACQGGPYDTVPNSPADLACISQPTNPVCAGGPYAPPTPPPVIAPPPVMAPPPMPLMPEIPTAGMPGSA